MFFLKNDSSMTKFFTLIALILISSHSFAYCDAPTPWQLGFQDSSTPIMEAIVDLHHKIFFYQVMISIFVLWLLVRALMLFNEKSNPTPSKVIHGTLIEIIWTLIPAGILLLIALPSFEMLYAMDEVIDAAITIKAVGHQWYWSYEYSDYSSSSQESISFDSYMVPEEDLEDGQLRLLEVDNRVVVPTNTHVRMIITAADVLHSWAVPSLGMKMDAIPGRLNQASMFIKREGVYYGQCSEICGVNHGFMPIVVESVPLEEYISWISNQIELTDKVIKAI